MWLLENTGCLFIRLSPRWCLIIVSNNLLGFHCWLNRSSTDQHTLVFICHWIEHYYEHKVSGWSHACIILAVNNHAIMPYYYGRRPWTHRTQSCERLPTPSTWSKNTQTDALHYFLPFFSFLCCGFAALCGRFASFLWLFCGSLQSFCFRIFDILQVVILCVFVVVLFLYFMVVLHMFLWSFCISFCGCFASFCGRLASLFVVVLCLFLWSFCIFFCGCFVPLCSHFASGFLTFCRCPWVCPLRHVL